MYLAWSVVSFHRSPCSSDDEWIVDDMQLYTPPSAFVVFFVIAGTENGRWLARQEAESFPAGPFPTPSSKQ